MKAKRVIVKVPVWNNKLYNPYNYGTAPLPEKEMDGYIDKEELHCPKCDAVLQISILYPGMGWYYCWRCKVYDIKAPDGEA